MASPTSHLSPKDSHTTTTPPLPNIDAANTARKAAFEDLTPNQKGELVALLTSRSLTAAERQKHLQYFTTTGKLRALFRPIFNEKDEQGNPLIPEDAMRMHMQVAFRSKDNAPVIEGAIPELEGIESTPRDKIHEVPAERTAMRDARAKIYALQSEPVDDDLEEDVTESDLDYAPTESGRSTLTESTLPLIPSTAGDTLETVDEMESNNTRSRQSATGDPLNQLDDTGDNWMLDDDIDIPSVSTESTHTRLLRARGADFVDLNGYAPTSGPSIPPYDLPVLPSDSNTHAHPTSSLNEMEQGEFRSLVDLDQQIQAAIDESTRAVLARQHDNQIEAKNNLRRLIKDRDKVIKSLGEIAARHRANEYLVALNPQDEVNAGNPPPSHPPRPTIDPNPSESPVLPFENLSFDSPDAAFEAVDTFLSSQGYPVMIGQSRMNKAKTAVTHVVVKCHRADRGCGYLLALRSHGDRRWIVTVDRGHTHNHGPLLFRRV